VRKNLIKFSMMQKRIGKKIKIKKILGLTGIQSIQYLMAR
jgi:hypothetical protein